MAGLDLLTLARMAADTYGPPCWTHGLVGDWYVHRYKDDENFHVRAYESRRSKLVVVAFRGSANWKDGVIADLGAIGLALNSLALKLNTAIDFTSEKRATHKNCWLVGHSLGGAYVQMLSAICEVPGTTFNAPGVLSLLNQMSPNAAVRLAGALGGGAMSVLSGHLSDYFNQAAAAMEDTAFQAVQNFRGNMDPVSLIGSHVGMPLQTLQLNDQSPHPHSMDPIIRKLDPTAPSIAPIIGEAPRFA